MAKRKRTPNKSKASSATVATVEQEQLRCLACGMLLTTKAPGRSIGEAGYRHLECP